MPSFKRREPASAAQGQRKPVRGLKPAPYPSLVHLFSTGLASLDDVLTGSGLPASSVLALCPALGLATFTGPEHEEAHQTPRVGAPKETTRHASTLASGSSHTLDALRAAENVALEVMSYSIAQGLIAGHETLVIGKGAIKLVENTVPNRATARDYSTKEPPATEEEEDLKIAFRYSHRPKFKTTVDEPEAVAEATKDVPEEHLFRSPLDTTKRWSAGEIAAAEKKERGRLRCLDLSSYEEMWSAIEEEVRRCKALQKDTSVSAPALRIHLPALGADNSQLVDLSRFLLRLRRLLKRVSLDEQSALPCICILSIAADLLAKAPSVKTTTLHLSRMVDSQLLISDFIAAPHLQRAYLGYGGGCSLLKGPSVGYLLPPGESRSVLRGGTAEAGAENDVGWKRRRKGVVLETLHEDVDAAVRKDDTAKEATPAKKKQGDDIEEAAAGLTRKEVAATAAVPAEKPAEKPRVKFEGLKSLRERGLRATKPVHVRVDKADDQW